MHHTREDEGPNNVGYLQSDDVELTKVEMTRQSMSSQADKTGESILNPGVFTPKFQYI